MAAPPSVLEICLQRMRTFLLSELGAALSLLERGPRKSFNKTCFHSRTQ